MKIVVKIVIILVVILLLRSVLPDWAAITLGLTGSLIVWGSFHMNQYDSKGDPDGSIFKFGKRSSEN